MFLLGVSGNELSYQGMFFQKREGRAKPAPLSYSSSLFMTHKEVFMCHNPEGGANWSTNRVGKILCQHAA